MTEESVPGGQPTMIERLLAQLGERMGGSGNVEVVFGPTRSLAGREVIPVARVAYGYGAGGGSAPPKEAGEEPPGGGGGGGGVTVTPLAVVEVTDDDLRVVPIVDRGKLLTRAVTLMGMAMIICALRCRKARSRAS